MLDDLFGWLLLTDEDRLMAGPNPTVASSLPRTLEVTLDDLLIWACWSIMEARFEAMPELTLADRFNGFDDSNTASSAEVE